MRIAYLTQSYPPMVSGASLAAKMLAEGMAKHGHQVLVLTSSDRNEPYTQHNETLTVYHNRSYANPFRVGQRYTRYVHRENIKLLYAFEPDIIHTHDPFWFAYTGLKYSQKRTIPIAITTHQLPWLVKAYLPEWTNVENLIEKGLWGYSSWLLQKFDHVISPTHTIAKVIYQQTGIHPDVINYGIELDYFHNGSKNEMAESILRNKFGIPLDVPIVLHIGRLDIDKNVDIAIRAAARSMVGNDAHLLVVGDGTEKTRLMKMCRGLGIGERSHFPGYISSRRELADVYRMATVFVTASEIETQGIVLLEAAACGLPIVAVNATCIPEIIKDGSNGFLVTPGDVDGMATCLRKLLSNQGNVERMGKEGYLVSKNFSEQKTVNEHAYLYAKAVLKSKRHSALSQKAWQNLRTPFG